MNAPRDGLIANLAGPVQPQIDKSLELLHSGYQESPGDLMLDLYGHFNADDGYFVEGVALTGSTVDLEGLLSHKKLMDLSRWCDDSLPDAAQMKEESRQEAMIDRAQERKESHW